ncbi:MAG: DUF4846 domain-containing protein [bacterium]|nr:DUF4846 domain-containing protein [bacterium]
MLKYLTPVAILTIVFTACSQTNNDSIPVGQQGTLVVEGNVKEFNPEGTTIETRYNPPAGFQRAETDTMSFAHYLRNLPLKAADEEVTYYNGGKKAQRSIYRSVVDLPIGNKNLHQCADAVMRFRAEYLWSTGQHNDIHFNFTNGFQVDYSKWLAGNRMVVSGNKTYWSPGSARSNTYTTFWKYMELIFNYAGTLSLEKELHSRDLNDMHIGDVLIQGGSPGHAVMVVDMCENAETGEKRFLLAQSYMPAQETQVLINPENPETSWYSLKNSGPIYTPEWTFYTNDLKHF